MTKRALLIGINYIPSKGASSASELRGCINDTLNVRKILIEKFGYKSQNILMMNDETDVKPTKDNIIKAMFDLIQGTTDNKYDQFFFQYSGHGSQVFDHSSDETDKKDEVLIPLDYATRGVITDDQVFDLLVKPLKSHQKLFCLIDACHSGTMVDLMYNIKTQTFPINTNPKKKYNPQEWSAKFKLSLEKRTQGTQGTVLLLSGCQDHELSNDAHVKPMYQGIMTYCFIETLKDNDFKIKCKYLLKDVNCLLDLYGFKTQNSQMSWNKYPSLEEYIDL